MRKRIGLLFLLTAIAVGLTAVPSMATKDTAKKEKKSCVTCHVKNGEKELNETGKYYKEKGTLEGFKKK